VAAIYIQGHSDAMLYENLIGGVRCWKCEALGP